MSRELINIDLVRLVDHAPICPATVEAKWRTLLADTVTPACSGTWTADGRFSIASGATDYLAALMRGHTKILAIWNEV